MHPLISERTRIMNETKTKFNPSANGYDTEPTLLELFVMAPEFEDFKKLLRRAAQVLTVADFVRLRKSYDAAWLNVIAEL